VDQPTDRDLTDDDFFELFQQIELEKQHDLAMQQYVELARRLDEQEPNQDLHDYDGAEESRLMTPSPEQYDRYIFNEDEKDLFTPYLAIYQRRHRDKHRDDGSQSTRSNSKQQSRFRTALRERPYATSAGQHQQQKQQHHHHHQQQQQHQQYQQQQQQQQQHQQQHQHQHQQQPPCML
jgi:hypothetical protein